MKKIVILTISAAMLSVGGVTVFAATGFNDLKGTISDRGEMKYSTDNGKNWSTKAPAGTKVTKDQSGVTSISTGNAGEAPKPDDSAEVKDESSIGVKTEDGKTMYSVDGGKTWSESIPKGYENSFK
ncbi:hypothetical protein [Xylocopilactobacillus apicola]|uniref:BNR/Asp-box repeat-containing protein n=1 Tax=Xylocopilactobacillus apicola TaxID=2932184 RepID=A0AAU9D3I3_9LACO|nr:hypothetical protein [Xylocopilactobacillus apicola]BDR57988.1 hypothetical protein XA3_04290 [Xylocopilactobacillus apicola]